MSEERELEVLKAGWEAMFTEPWDGSQAVMMGAAWDAMRKAAEGPRIKPQIILDLREWAEFEQDGGNVEQGAAIDVILDWYDRQTGLDTSRSR